MRLKGVAKFWVCSMGVVNEWEGYYIIIASYPSCYLIGQIIPPIQLLRGNSLGRTSSFPSPSPSPLTLTSLTASLMAAVSVPRVPFGDISNAENIPPAQSLTGKNKSHHHNEDDFGKAAPFTLTVRERDLLLLLFLFLLFLSL